MQSRRSNLSDRHKRILRNTSVRRMHIYSDGNIISLIVYSNSGYGSAYRRFIQFMKLITPTTGVRTSPSHEPCSLCYNPTNGVAITAHYDAHVCHDCVRCVTLPATGDYIITFNFGSFIVILRDDGTHAVAEYTERHVLDNIGRVGDGLRLHDEIRRRSWLCNIAMQELVREVRYTITHLAIEGLVQCSVR